MPSSAARPVPRRLRGVPACQPGIRPRQQPRELVSGDGATGSAREHEGAFVSTRGQPLAAIRRSGRDVRGHNLRP